MTLKILSTSKKISAFIQTTNLLTNSISDIQYIAPLKIASISYSSKQQGRL